MLIEEVKAVTDLYNKGAIFEDIFIYLLRSFCLAAEGKPTKRFYRNERGKLIAY